MSLATVTTLVDRHGCIRLFSSSSQPLTFQSSFGLGSASDGEDEGFTSATCGRFELLSEVHFYSDEMTKREETLQLE